MSLLLNATEFMAAVKKAALETIEASKPVNVYFGEVVSVSPLQINVEQKMMLGEKQLVLTEKVSDYTMELKVDWQTERESDHVHDISGRKKIVVYNGLGLGDKVILIRQQGGQKFIVIDRVGGEFI